MLIAIPSKGRAGKTKTDRFLGQSTLYVPESEAEDYRRHSKVEVVAVPNSVKGITATRNWILENTDQRYVVMVDDDLHRQGYTKLYPEKVKERPMTEQAWCFEFARLFAITEDLGWKIWGVKTEGSPRSVYPYKPLNFRSYITASCMGLVNDGEFLFDEQFKVKEDYEIGLRHVEKYGGVLCARYLFWQNTHWHDEGGCKEYRTQKVEAEAIRLLVEKYPNRIKQITRGGSGYSIELHF